MKKLAFLILIVVLSGCGSYHLPSANYYPFERYSYNDSLPYISGGGGYYESYNPYFDDNSISYEPYFYRQRHQGFRGQPYADDPLGEIGIYYPNVRTREIRTGYGMPYQPSTRRRELKTILGTEDEPLGKIGSRYRP